MTGLLLFLFPSLFCDGDAITDLGQKLGIGPEEELELRTRYVGLVVKVQVQRQFLILQIRLRLPLHEFLH